jgi:hypothetical protein
LPAPPESLSIRSPLAIGILYYSKMRIAKIRKRN